jgi:hypothetical protein
MCDSLHIFIFVILNEFIKTNNIGICNYNMDNGKAETRARVRAGQADL